QDGEGGVGGQGQAGAERAACRSCSGTRLWHRLSLSRKGFALREGHCDDRRRRGWRAHRIAADYFLLPPDAKTDRRRQTLSRGAAALSALAWWQDRLCTRRQAQGNAAQKGIPRKCQSGGFPSKEPRRK